MLGMPTSSIRRNSRMLSVCENGKEWAKRGKRGEMNEVEYVSGSGLPRTTM